MNKDRDKDLELVERCINGDRAAIELLVHRYQRPVYNAAYRLLGNIDDARDITQTVFMKVFEQLDDYDSRYRFFSWIYRIAVNESLNMLRKTGREQPMSGMEQVADDDNPETVTDQRAIAVRVQSTLMRMHSEDRVVLVLRHFLDCSYRDISGVLDIPEKTVKSRLYSARQRMRELVMAWYEK